VLHCSDTPNDMYVDGDMIRDWHTSPRPRGNGWKKVGYSKVIRRDGTVDTLVENDNDGYVDSNEITNGAWGVNSISYHVCLIGGKNDKGQPSLEMTDEQKESLIGILKDKIVEKPDVKIAGHCHFSDYKTCPNFNLEQFLESIGVSKENILY